MIPGKALAGVALAVVVDAETAFALTLGAVKGTVVVAVVKEVAISRQPPNQPLLRHVVTVLVFIFVDMSIDGVTGTVVVVVV